MSDIQRLDELEEIAEWLRQARHDDVISPAFSASVLVRFTELHARLKAADALADAVSYEGKLHPVAHLETWAQGFISQHGFQDRSAFIVWLRGAADALANYQQAAEKDE